MCAVGGVSAGGEGVEHECRDLVGGPALEVRHQVICGQPVLAVGVQVHPVHQTRFPLTGALRVSVGGDQLLLEERVVHPFGCRESQEASSQTATGILGHPPPQQGQRLPAEGQKLCHRPLTDRHVSRHRARHRPGPTIAGPPAVRISMRP